jgi:hypothetical protein
MDILLNELNCTFQNMLKNVGIVSDLDRINWLHKNKFLIMSIITNKTNFNKYRFDCIKPDIIIDIYNSLLISIFNFNQNRFNSIDKLITINYLISDFIKLFRDIIPEEIYHLDLEYNKVINLNNNLDIQLLQNSIMSKFNNNNDDMTNWLNNKRDITISNKIYDKPDDCSVCMSKVHCYDRLSCGHYVHKHCIVSSGKTQCPMCRNEVYLTKDELIQTYYNSKLL